jgi:hypothetical protein
MRRLALTPHTVRCPLDDRLASLTVRTDPEGDPSRRHRDLIACSLLPSTSFVVPARRGHFSDVAPPMSYLYEVPRSPHHSLKVTCRKRCLAVLNAAEPGAAEPVPCTSGVNDALELARQTQSPGIMRLLWLHGA